MTTSSRPPAEPLYWRRAHIVQPLLALAYFERATAHIVCGWLPKIESVEIKVELGQQQHRTMVHAAKLERAYASALKFDGAADLAVPRRYRSAMKAIDGSITTPELLRRLYGDVKPALAVHYARVIAAANPTLDAPLLEILRAAHAELRRQIAWAKPRIGRRPRGAPRFSLASPGSAGARSNAKRCGDTIDARGPRIARADWLWKPLARVPECARPPAIANKKPGELLPSVIDHPGSRRAGGGFFSNITNSELATMELYARCVYEHPDMPEAFHQDYSRITADEARHAAIAMRWARRLGRPFGSFAISTDIYTFNYQYEACPAGSKQELLWRLMLQGTLREGLIIEGYPTQAKKLRFRELAEAARVAEVMAEEEIAHVEAALKWTRFLCDGDNQRAHDERERAHAYYAHHYNEARKRYVAEHPDDAIEDTRQLVAYRKLSGETFPFSLAVHVNRAARRSIGFTEQEIDQICNWGYLNP